MAAALYDETAGIPEGNRGPSAGLVYAWGEHSLADPVFGDYPERFLTLEHTEPGVLLPLWSKRPGDDASVAELSWGPHWGTLWRDTTLEFFTGFRYLADATYPTDDRLVLDWSLDGTTKSEDVIITQDTVETGREVPAGALGALAAVGAGLGFLARGRVRRV
ncbi:hypothetical protein [Micrococcus luteus]|uniref:hypothetical protein n=1 Tax=Micrococcus luteus TaxID=1270 RepID=UPI00368AE6B8